MKTAKFKFGLAEKEYQFILEQVANPLRRLGAEVYCFGSRARGQDRKFSDLDLLIESEKDLSKKISLIEEQLVRSNFKYKVDLVSSENLAESYKENIFKEKKIF